jgi:RNA polymerase sigma factor (sigma-70 family)
VEPQKVQDSNRSTARLKKLTPKVSMPTAAFMGTLDDLDKKILKLLLDGTVECLFDPRFKEPDAEEQLFADKTYSNDDSGIHSLDSGMAGWWADNEGITFLRYNYCRYRVLCLLRKYREKRLPAEAARQVLKWQHRVLALRADIVASNMSLVLAMAKRTRITSVDQAEMISEGNLALLRAADKFDCARGYKFSTYACRAILKSFSRAAVRASRYRGYFPTEFDPALEKGDSAEIRRGDLEADCIDELKCILDNNRAHLNDVEQTVIRARFAIPCRPSPAADGPKTLEQVGSMIGVTKERVRQIQNKALGKLKSILESEILVA